MRRVHSTGAVVRYLSNQFFEAETGIPKYIGKTVNPVLTALCIAQKATSTAIKAAECEAIAQAPDAEPEEIENIRAAQDAQEDVTPAQMLVLSRHYLRNTYNYNGSISPHFVKVYSDPKVRRIYKNWSRITSYGTTLGAALKCVQEDERNEHEYHMSAEDSKKYRDLSTRAVYNQHRYAITLLRIIGRNSLTDPTCIEVAELAQQLRHYEDLYWDTVKAAYTALEFAAPRQYRFSDYQSADPCALVKAAMGPVNRVLRTMYGIGFGPDKNAPDIYLYQPCKLFAATEDEAYRLGAPIVEHIHDI